MKLAFGIQWAKGLLFGIRHFQPEEYAPYYEVQFFSAVIQIFIIKYKKDILNYQNLQKNLRKLIK